MNLRTHRRGLMGLAALLVLFGAWWLTIDECVSTWAFQGVKMPRCPDGTMRQTVELQAVGLSRESTSQGSITVSAVAHGVTEDGSPLQAPVRRLTPSLFLVDAEGRETPLSREDGWEKVERSFAWRHGVKLPTLPDGDYRLRARVTSKLGTDSVDAPLPLYAQARIHVLTDRPLYEPGHTVRFRAVILRARDHAPLDGRPGTWFVTDPSGEVLLERRLPAGPWGVVSGDFPLDRGASTGLWNVRWKSGEDSGETSFEVKPFTLPRFQVKASSTRPFWRAGESPLVEGQVVYASGAPVANASVKVDWQTSGAWPPPRAWLDPAAAGTLPREVRADGSGRFRLTLPRVPLDLRGKATLSAGLAATDPAGEQVRGSAAVLLAEDALAVSAVTEIEGGLVEGYDNRVYLRATTASGELLPGTELTVRRAWDPEDKGVRAVTDEDGVAAFQLDPGPPVNVVLPALPVRPTPTPPRITLSEVADLLAENEASSLEDGLALERALASLHPCERFVSPGQSVLQPEFALRVTAGGAVVDVLQDDTALGDCIATRLRALTLPGGRERMLKLGLSVTDKGLPTLSLEHHSASAEGEVPDKLSEVLERAALDARECLPPALSVDAPVPLTLTWRIRPGKREVEVGWVPRRGLENPLPTAHLACLQARFAGLRLDEDNTAADMGVTQLTAEPAEGSEEEGEPQDRTMLGYELKVSAKREKEDLGSTTWVATPARLPSLRLRVSPSIVHVGDAVRVEVLRGPDFQGEPPKSVVLRSGDFQVVQPVERSGPVPAASVVLTHAVEGWAEISSGDVQAWVYVEPRARLTLEVSPDRTAYAPGALAHLQVNTWVDGQKGPAAVGLFGVDESLSQLTRLPEPDTLDTLRPAPLLDSPAFGVLDGTALVMGRIRGANATAATMLRVTRVPGRVEAERIAPLSAQQSFVPDEELTEPFYRVLTELTTRVRAWETSAPEGETMSPEGMAKQWTRAVEACEQRGEQVRDAFGRPLRLSRLPPELLALTDPRAVVVSGTRLPQDIENWGAWVARESP